MGDPHRHDWPGEFTFCPHCATALEARTIGDKVRMVCPSCDFVHWRNPAVGAAVVVFDESNRLLLVKRSPEATMPGLWSIPAGFVDYGEDVREAAARELHEETGLVASIGEPVFVASNFHDPAKLTVGIWFDAEVTGGRLRPGDDAAEVGYFSLDELPPRAFETDAELIALMRDSDPHNEAP